MTSKNSTEKAVQSVPYLLTVSSRAGLNVTTLTSPIMNMGTQYMYYILYIIAQFSLKQKARYLHKLTILTL